MQKINSSAELHLAIAALELQQTAEAKLLKQQFNLAYESIKPVNLIKSTLKDISASQDLKDNLLNSAVGITVGYVSKKIFEGTSHSPVKRMLGTALMFGVTNAVAKNPETLKAAIRGIAGILSKLKTTGRST